MKSAADERAAVVHQLRLRNVAKMRKIAKSATASVEANALDDVRNGYHQSKMLGGTCCSTQSLEKSVSALHLENLGTRRYLSRPKYRHQPNRSQRLVGFTEDAEDSTAEEK